MGKTLELYGILKYIVVFGDVCYILFLLHNGIDEGFKGISRVQSLAPIGMILLLILNIILLSRKRNIY